MSNTRLPRRVEHYAAVVFDCDGVVLASNELKAEMLGRALDGEDPPLVADFVAHYKRNAGTSRYRLYDHFYTVMKPVADPAAHVEATVARYAALLREGLRGVAEMPGIRGLLERLNAHRVPCYVNSGSDEEELRDVFAERGLAPYFAGIFGSPRTKIENLSRIPGLGGAAQGLVLGDARSDLKAAETRDLDFVFVSADSDWEDGPGYCADHGIPVIATPADIGEIEPVAAK